MRSAAGIVRIARDLACTSGIMIRVSPAVVKQAKARSQPQRGESFAIFPTVQKSAVAARKGSTNHARRLRERAAARCDSGHRGGIGSCGSLLAAARKRALAEAERARETARRKRALDGARQRPPDSRRRGLY